ncbi:MAG: B12-binding domain-containing radical SAM protein [Desulfobaccales bacterium]
MPETSLNILIIATNRNRFPAPVLPYGACMVAEATAAAGHRVSFLDLMFRADPLQAVAAALRSFPADVIGLSVRNLDNNDAQAPVAYVSQLLEIGDTLRNLTRAPLVLGGAALGVMPEALLRCTGAAAAVLGDGESAFPALLRSWNGDRGGFQAAPRVAWLDNGRLQVSAADRASLGSASITPRFERWLDPRPYRANLAAAPLQSKRGCPFTCTYCTYGISEGREYRLVPPEEAAAAVQRLEGRGWRDVEFVDNVFNAPYDHALEVCEHLARRRTRVRLQTLELNPAFIDKRLLKAMERAGFVGLGVTAESAADPVLAGLQKGFHRGQLEQAAAAIRGSLLPVLWMYLLGGPGETQETVSETLDFAQRTLRPGDVAYFNVGIRIYPGTELERQARRQGVLAASQEEMLTPEFYVAPELDLPQTLSLLRRAAAENLNLLHSASLSHPWLPAVSRWFGRLPLTRPLWRHTRSIRRGLRILGRDI